MNDKDAQADSQEKGTGEDAPAEEPAFPALRRLTAKQRKFVLAYCGPARLNASRAALLAGYATPGGSERFVGFQVKKSPNVQAAIQEVLDVTGGSVEEAVYRLGTRARGTIDNVLAIGEDGSVTVDLKKARETDEIHNIKSIRHTKHGISVEMYDAQAADFRLLNHYRNKRLDDMDAREAYLVEREAELDAVEAENAAAGPGGRRQLVEIHYYDSDGTRLRGNGYSEYSSDE